MKVVRVILRQTVNLPRYRQASSLGDLNGDRMTQLEGGAIEFTDGIDTFRFPESMIAYIQYETPPPEVQVFVEPTVEPARPKKPGAPKAPR